MACVIECDHETCTVRRDWPTRGCLATGRGGGINTILCNLLIPLLNKLQINSFSSGLQFL